MINKDKFDDSYLYSSHKKYDITIDKNKKMMIYTCTLPKKYDIIIDKNIKNDDLYLYSSQALLSCIELGPQLAFGRKASFSLSTGGNHVGGDGSDDNDGDGDDGDDDGDDGDGDDTDADSDITTKFPNSVIWQLS